MQVREPKVFPSNLKIPLERQPEEEKCGIFTFNSVWVRLGIGDLVQGPLVPPVHGGDGLAPRGLHDDDDGSGQHAEPAQPEEDEQHEASPHPPEGKGPT